LFVNYNGMLCENKTKQKTMPMYIVRFDVHCKCPMPIQAETDSLEGGGVLINQEPGMKRDLGIK